MMKAYGECKAKLYQLWTANPNLTAKDYARMIGCTPEYIRRLGREHSLKLKQAPRLNFKYQSRRKA